MTNIDIAKLENKHVDRVPKIISFFGGTINIFVDSITNFAPICNKLLFWNINVNYSSIYLKGNS